MYHDNWRQETCAVQMGKSQIANTPTATMLARKNHLRGTGTQFFLFPEFCPSVWGACLGVVDVVAPGQRDHARADEAGQVIYVPVHHLRARPASPCVPYHMSAHCNGTPGK